MLSNQSALRDWCIHPLTPAQVAELTNIWMHRRGTRVSILHADWSRLGSNQFCHLTYSHPRARCACAFMRARVYRRCRTAWCRRAIKFMRRIRICGINVSAEAWQLLTNNPTMTGHRGKCERASLLRQVDDAQHHSRETNTRAVTESAPTADSAAPQSASCCRARAYL